MKLLQTSLLLILFFLALFSAQVSAECTPEQVVDAELKETIIISGAVSTVPVLQKATNEFGCFFPGVTFSIRTASSEDSANAFINEDVHIAALSRTMNTTEISSFLSKSGKAPDTIRLGLDPVLVVVNPLNPINSLSIQQLDAIFSESRKCGFETAISNWSELSENFHGKIAVFYHDNSSETHETFRSLALCNGSYSNQAKSEKEFSNIVQTIQKEPLSISMIPNTRKTSRIKILDLEVNGQTVKATPANVLSGLYPISNSYNLYFNKQNLTASKIELKFLRYLKSRNGKELIEKSGLISN